MKKKYKDNDLNQFYRQFKAMPDYYRLDQVHHLINNPPAKATQRGKTSINHLNITIMTITIMGLGLLLYWWAPLQINQTAETVSPEFEKTENVPKIIKKKRPDLTPAGKNLALSNAPIKDAELPNNSRSTSPQPTKNTPIINPWPEDTVIDGNSLIVTLTNEELKKIGFMLDETGIYYKNIWQGDTVYFHRRRVALGGEFTRVSGAKNRHNKKQLYSNFDFFPARITKYIAHRIEEGEFASENDLLIPILINPEQIKVPETEYLLWLQPSDQLFELFPQKFQRHQEIYGKIQAEKALQPEKNLVVYLKENRSADLIEELSMIQLSKKELSELGFEIRENKISFSSTSLEINLFPNGRSINDNSSKGPNQKLDSKISLVFLTNIFGEQQFQWITKKDQIEKSRRKYFDEKIQHLVPVLLNNSDYPSILSEDQIFWFEPSEALFAALPPDTGNQLRQEYELITSDSEELKSGSSCTFFEACRSTLHLRRLSIYPNPASGHTSLDFELAKPITGRVALLDISGKPVKELVPQRSFKTGRNAFTFDLSDVQEGIYLLTIYSDHGFKTYRLMVSR
ncbi:MAG: T9SS type A sorting domain-containing protein [Candidatus Cyclobacteriaceae bacterium M3_2C_046]